MGTVIPTYTDVGGNTHGVSPTHPLPVLITHPSANSGGVDAFARQRMSTPQTLFDSKQIFDNAPLFWDDQEVSGSGTSSTYDINKARSQLAVSNLTAGKRIRQTFMRFNYQSGKSQLVLMTGVLGMASTGITQEAGQFDDNNGIGFRCEGMVLQAFIRSFATGSAVDTVVNQADFNLDTLDGNGPSGVLFDGTKTQIIIFDYEWLGVGRVRMGFVHNGEVLYCHQFLNSNNLDVVYMSTPNLPLRYAIENDGTGPVTTLDTICATVISEGGSDDNGVLKYRSTEGSHIDANVADTLYIVMGIRLKTAGIGATIKMVTASMSNSTNDDFEWTLRLNPTVANAITFTDETDSPVQTGPGNTGSPSNSTVIGGVCVGGGFVKGGSSGSVSADLENALLLGAAIDGTRDELYLCVRPLTTNADIDGGFSWREIA